MNSPTTIECNEDHAKHVYECFDCDGRLAGSKPVTIQGPFVHPGGVQYRMEERTSKDGTCVLQEDVIVSADGQEQRFTVSLEVDDKVWWVRRTEPIQT